MFKNFSWKSSVLLGALALVACKGVCGDGVIDTEGNKDDTLEACDDANTTPNDGCNATCSKVDVGFLCSGEPSVCVENVENNDALCTDGVDNDGDQLIDCADENCAQLLICAVCGDGQLVQGAEQCDDANTTPGDGCDANCDTEAGSTFNFTGVDNDGTVGDSTKIKFGAFEFVSFGSGAATGFVIVTSSDPDICNTIDLAGGIVAFQDALFNANGKSIGNGVDSNIMNVAIAGDTGPGVVNKCSNDPAIACTTATEVADCGVGNTCNTPVVGLGRDPIQCSNDATIACTAATEVADCGAGNTCEAPNTFVDNFFCNADGSFCVQSDSKNIFTLTDLTATVDAGGVPLGANLSFTIDAGSNFTGDASPAVFEDLTTPFPLTATGVAFECPFFF